MERVLYELSPVPALKVGADAVLLTRKLLDGLRRYAELWPGPLTAVLPPAAAANSSLDPVEVRLPSLGFGLKVLPFDGPELRALVKDAGLVHWGPHHLLHDLGDLLRGAGVPSVYITEYSLRTRREIIDASEPGLLRRWRRRLWEARQERLIRRNVARVTGFEANGTPTFEAYRGLNPRHLLFFDSRTTAGMVISREALERRLARAARPLHLVYSGRLAEMKGAADLIEVAAELRKRGTPFRMSICGAGPLEASMRARVWKEGLGRDVTFRGVLSFADELLPFLREEADVFVCCHKQGDPSCTYLETFACGVPIAGYENEAFEGLMKRVRAGWATPMNDPKALAALLSGLRANRASLAERSRAARTFAAENTFERTFEARMAFCREAAAL
jgi:glycosyltransferase involved in cell wall biosynthesis